MPVFHERNVGNTKQLVSTEQIAAEQAEQVVSKKVEPVAEPEDKKTKKKNK